MRWDDGLRAVGAVQANTVRVATRRAVFGPRRPTWSFSYELFVSVLRQHVGSVLGRDPASCRKLLDRLGDRTKNSKKLEWTPVQVGAMYGEWCRPRAGAGSTVILFLHGGAYVTGSVKSHRLIIGSLAKTCSAKVLGVDYRLAPEHTFPAAVDDAVAAYRWLLDGGTPPRRIVLAGDSAGGGLSVSTLMRIRDERLPEPAGAVCMSPWLDLSGGCPSVRANERYDYLWDAELLRYHGISYAGAVGVMDPHVSPLFVDLSGLPPMLIQVGSAELLRDECVRFVDMARVAGTDARLDLAEDQVHVWQMMVQFEPAARAAFERIGTFVDEISGG